MPLGFSSDTSFHGPPVPQAIHPNLPVALSTIRAFALPGEHVSAAVLMLLAKIQHGATCASYHEPVRVLIEDHMSRGLRLGGRMLTTREIAALVETPSQFAKRAAQAGH